MYIGVIQCVDVNNMLFRCFLCVQVHVLVKVMEQREKEKIMTRANKLMDKTVYAVSDKTASIMLTVWGDDVLVLDTWYSFTSVSVRLFNSKVLLTTTPITIRSPKSSSQPYHI